MATERELIAIDSEIRRLSLRIALARYELLEAVLAKIPLGLCAPFCAEISICQLQKRALEDGHYHELPYNIKLLYK